MISDFILEFEHKGKIKPSEIEDFIKSKNIEPVRYAIIRKEEDKFIISVSGIKK